MAVNGEERAPRSLRACSSIRLAPEGGPGAELNTGMQLPAVLPAGFVALPLGLPQKKREKKLLLWVGKNKAPDLDCSFVFALTHSRVSSGRGRAGDPRPGRRRRRRNAGISPWPLAAASRQPSGCGGRGFAWPRPPRTASRRRIPARRPRPR
jgi:hypothetical protein